jgi:hypothetical protein
MGEHLTCALSRLEAAPTEWRVDAREPLSGEECEAVPERAFLTTVLREDFPDSSARTEH